jgi:hypothetical protein
MWCPGLNPSVKLHALHGSVIPVGVIILLGLCNPPRRGCGELMKPGLLYPRSRSRIGSIASDLESWVTCCDR